MLELVVSEVDGAQALVPVVDGSFAFDRRQYEAAVAGSVVVLGV